MDKRYNENMDNKIKKYLSLESLVKYRFVPYSNQNSFYKVLTRKRLLRPEFGFRKWSQAWVIDESFVPRLQEYFLKQNELKKRKCSWQWPLLIAFWKEVIKKTKTCCTNISKVITKVQPRGTLFLNKSHFFIWDNWIVKNVI